MDRKEIHRLLSFEIRTRKRLMPPDTAYWRAVEDWFVFHAPHVGDALLNLMAREFVWTCDRSVAAGGRLPDPPSVPESVRSKWEGN